MLPPTVSPDDHRCGSRWKLEFDYAEAAALGGPSTIDNLRLRCRVHNALHAEETFGRAFMARYRRRQEPRMGESTIAGERALRVKSAAASPVP